jgi:hypothetical protein
MGYCAGGHMGVVEYGDGSWQWLRPDGVQPGTPQLSAQQSSVDWHWLSAWSHCDCTGRLPCPKPASADVDASPVQPASSHTLESPPHPAARRSMQESASRTRAS